MPQKRVSCSNALASSSMLKRQNAIVQSARPNPVLFQIALSGSVTLLKAHSHLLLASPLSHKHHSRVATFVSIDKCVEYIFSKLSELSTVYKFVATSTQSIEIYATFLATETARAVSFAIYLKLEQPTSKYQVWVKPRMRNSTKATTKLFQYVVVYFKNPSGWGLGLRSRQDQHCFLCTQFQQTGIADSGDLGLARHYLNIPSYEPEKVTMWIDMLLDSLCNGPGCVVPPTSAQPALEDCRVYGVCCAGSSLLTFLPELSHVMDKYVGTVIGMQAALTASQIIESAFEYDLIGDGDARVIVTQVVPALVRGLVETPINSLERLGYVHSLKILFTQCTSINNMILKWQDVVCELAKTMCKKETSVYMCWMLDQIGAIP